MINMDMIGRIKDDKVLHRRRGHRLDVQAAAGPRRSSDSDFKLEYSAGGYRPSDHTSFVTKKIPVLFFFSGLHSDYHKPSDTWDKINAPGGEAARSSCRRRRA